MKMKTNERGGVLQPVCKMSDSNCSAVGLAKFALCVHEAPESGVEAVGTVVAAYHRQTEFDV